MSLMSLGVLASSRKENEFRLPLHPAHLDRIAPDVRGRMFLEQGHGARFGVADDTLGPLVAGLRSREQLLAECDVLLLPKPVHDDIAALREGQVLWGWPHCVQDEELTQLAVGACRSCYVRVPKRGAGRRSWPSSGWSASRRACLQERR
ncbi:hypothetical protein [Streptomyces sp. NPDC048665]|uniref:hypothetical protein n=1 Tax=Streptomyces sp. NPDC048665 TaxID=3155490 RepID=UPI00343FD65E